MNKIAFFDTEVTSEEHKLLDIGCIKSDIAEFHSGNRGNFLAFVEDCHFLCGHNIFAHDLKYVQADLEAKGQTHEFIDTLYLSPLFFPARPYHKLLKNNKLQVDDLNNPLSDAKKAKDLFYDMVTEYYKLPQNIRDVFIALLWREKKFSAFFKYVSAGTSSDAESLIITAFEGRICSNINMKELIDSYPAELAYCLALINADNKYSIIPPWVSKKFPQTDFVMSLLRNIPCSTGCKYCSTRLNIHTNLKKIFGYDSFRTYEGEPLQEQATQAAVDGKSILKMSR